MGYLIVFILGFIAGGFLTRKSVWDVIQGKARFAVIPKSVPPEPRKIVLSGEHE